MKTALIVSSPAWLHAYAWLVAVGTLFPVLSGALVASREAASGVPGGWGLSSGTGHPAAAGAAGLLAIGLAGCLLLVEKRAWLRRLAWMLLAGVAAEAVLGLLAGPASPWGMVHAFLAPLILAAIVAIAHATSRGWQRDPQLLHDKGWPSLRSLGRNTVVLVVIQVALGVAFRYEVLGVMPHILGALVVVVFILGLMVCVTMLPEHPTLRPAAMTLGVIAFVQVFLGLTIVTLGSGTKLPVAALAAAHVTIGSLTLAATVVVALEIWRNVRAQSDAT
jgi:heme A synthase